MTRPVAGVVLLEAAQPEPALLLIRRSARPGDPWSGHWALPGGRREDDDHDLLATALRELHEECGIALPRQACTRALRPRHAGRHVGRPLLVAPFHVALDRRPTVTPQPAEVAGYRWCPLRVLGDRARHRHGRINPHHPDRVHPHLPIDGHPLWGFTYEVVTRWLGLAAL